MINMKQIYIKRDYGKWWEDYQKATHLFDDESRYCEVPNSLGGEPHPQFTLTLPELKITFWCEAPKYGEVSEVK